MENLTFQDGLNESPKMESSDLQIISYETAQNIAWKLLGKKKGERIPDEDFKALREYVIYHCGEENKKGFCPRVFVSDGYCGA